MRGHMSAHSFATGPAIADPFISPFGLNHTGVVLEVDELSVLPAEGLALAHNYGWQHLLTESWGTLLDGCHHKVTGGGGREPVEASTNALYGDDVKVLGTGVVGAVHDCGHRETEGHPEFVACSSPTSSLAHDYPK